MKTRFSSLDIGFELLELNQSLVGMRVNRVYDVDHKTYLFKLQKPEHKVTLLLESGTRIHTTKFEWPKNEPPSGFTMKLRKHLTNKRLEYVRQMGVDRVIDLQFGSNEAASHLILEMYDKGNMVLTDHNYLILNILRPRVKGEDKFLARETYPIDHYKRAPQDPKLMTPNVVKDLVFRDFKPNSPLRKLLLPHVDMGPSFLDHLMALKGLSGSSKVGEVTEELCQQVADLIHQGQTFSLSGAPTVGLIRQSKHPKVDGGWFYRYTDFHPMDFAQFKGEETDCMLKFDSYDLAVDDFFSNLEGQKIEAKALQMEQQSVKKLENVKKDHANRIDQLEKDQSLDKSKGHLIETNNDVVERALNLIRTALANQTDWKEIEELVEEATESGDPLVSKIKKLKLNVNQMSLLLSDPYDSEADEVLVDLDIGMSAQANARKYFTKKKTAATKVMKTVQSQAQAIKSAEKRAKQAMRDVNAIARIVKQRKVFWFEKFFWFISSENYLVIAGRDQQQNELIFKRYLGLKDIYLHAEVQGASSVVIKNPKGGEVPPKTLHEAGQMALCYSVAWDSKVVISAYWVHADQVSKSAPTGEYLTTGSFMIRGKKNFLPPSQLVLGFGFMFKLDDDSIERHLNERKERPVEIVDQVQEELEECVLDDEQEETKDDDQEETKDDDMEETKDDDAANDGENKSEAHEEPETSSDKSEANECTSDTNEPQNEDTKDINEASDGIEQGISINSLKRRT